MKIKSMSGTDFQHFFQEIMKIKFGDLIDTLGDSSDLGADCILKNEDGSIKKIYAIYGPESHKYGLPTLKSKFADDYVSFKKNWDYREIDWVPVCNRKFTGGAYKYLKTLANPKEFYDVDKIKDLIFTFNYSRISRVCNYLNIEPQFLVHNILDIIINDIISLEIDVIENDFEKIPPELKDKIRKNFEIVYHDLIEKFYKEEYYVNISTFKDYFEKLSSNDQKIVKSKYQNVYSRFITLPDFQITIDNIINQFGQLHLKDDYYMYWLKIITYYMFEICIIGKEPKK